MEDKDFDYAAEMVLSTYRERGLEDKFNRTRNRKGNHKEVLNCIKDIILLGGKDKKSFEWLLDGLNIRVLDAITYAYDDKQSVSVSELTNGGLANAFAEKLAEYVARMSAFDCVAD